MSWPRYSLSTPLIFFFTAPAPPPTYTLSLHDALPISINTHLALAKRARLGDHDAQLRAGIAEVEKLRVVVSDRKSTRLNSSHRCISYAVFCLKKKKSCRFQSTGRPARPIRQGSPGGLC